MDFNKLIHDLYPWMSFAIAFSTVVLAGKMVLFLAFRQLSRLAARTAGNWDDDLLHALRRPLSFLVYIGALAAGLQFAPEAVTLTKGHWNLFRLAMVFWIFWTLWLTSTALLRSSLTHDWSEEARNLVLLLFRVVILLLSILGLAETLGLSLTPVLASLGVGSLAVALALQDTLANFFAGIYLLIDKPVRVGDFVKIDESTEGTVQRIGWRSTWIAQTNRNVIVIPNNKLLSAQLVNYNLVQSECFLSLPVGVSYSADLEDVEKVLIDVATEVLKSEGIYDANNPPFVRYRQFGESSIDLSVGVQLQEISQQFMVRHKLIKAIHASFSQRGIDIPFPQRTVHLAQPPGAK